MGRNDFIGFNRIYNQQKKKSDRIKKIENNFNALAVSVPKCDETLDEASTEDEMEPEEPFQLVQGVEMPILQYHQRMNKSTRGRFTKKSIKNRLQVIQQRSAQVLFQQKLTQALARRPKDSGKCRVVKKTRHKVAFHARVQKIIYEEHSPASVGYHNTPIEQYIKYL